MKFRAFYTLVLLVFVITTGYFGFTPCENVCKGHDLWKQTYNNGECITSEIIEKNSIKCLNPLEKEEYAVYNALIETGIYIFGTDSSVLSLEAIVVKDEASLEFMKSYVVKKDQAREYMAERMPEVEQETFEDFKMKNTEPYPLHNFFDVSIPIVLVNKEEINEILRKENGDNIFLSTYNSDVFVTLSRVGFNAEMDQALVYAGISTTIGFGIGYYVLLVKEGGHWKVHNGIEAWYT
ncbi:MAG: hypothetical protein PVF58_15995 [Candidatus Methanofastidiosia archaeon]|jgi:hypothetical protein